MLDMGFRPAVDRIVALTPRTRQTLFFSATLEGDAGKIAGAYTSDARRHEHVPAVDHKAETVHRFVRVQHEAKVDVLVEELKDAERGLTIVFVRTKRGADRLVKRLKDNYVTAVAMHGDKSQSQREKALARFERGEVDILVATDVAARGIDVRDVTHVINYDMPEDRDGYVHRTGRTGRAGRAGIGVTFVLGDQARDMSRIASDLGLHKEFSLSGLPTSTSGGGGGARAATAPTAAAARVRAAAVRSSVRVAASARLRPGARAATAAPRGSSGRSWRPSDGARVASAVRRSPDDHDGALSEATHTRIMPRLARSSSNESHRISPLAGRRRARHRRAVRDSAAAHRRRPSVAHPGVHHLLRPGRLPHDRLLRSRVQRRPADGAGAFPVLAVVGEPQQRRRPVHRLVGRRLRLRRLRRWRRRRRRLRLIAGVLEQVGWVAARA